MEVKIGVIYTPRELAVEIEGKADEIVAMLESSLKDGRVMMWLTDKRGRRVGVPADKIAYVEVVEDEAVKRVGFGPG
jgi:hypothetical protein